MFDLPFSYGSRRRVIERRRRLVEDRPDRAIAPDVVDLLRRQGVSATDAHWLVDRAAEEQVSPSTLWRRLRTSTPDGAVPSPRLSRDALLAIATGHRVSVVAPAPHWRRAS